MDTKYTSYSENITNNISSIKQIRLHKLSVFNWGSFDGLHTATIDAHGTLITGDNGAGKSTLIDGLMALLLPAGRATFNVAAAQGDRSDRSLLSYMRGSFGSRHDGVSTRVKSKRESAVVTGLRALYCDNKGNIITLVALFWTTQATNSLADVKRLYVVATRDLTLKEMLDLFAEGNTRTLKQHLKDDPTTTCCDDNFASYQELYRKHLYMENKNAPALLSRALGLKKIDDLTNLIRELVLEPSAVKYDAKKVVDEFADLMAIHTELVNAREQRDHLSKLPELDKQIKNAELKITNLQDERDGLPVYLSKICYQLWSEKIVSFNEELTTLVFTIKQINKQEEDAEELVEGRHEDYIKTGGGRIESLKKDLKQTQGTLTRITNKASKYQTDIGILELNDKLCERQFSNNQSLIQNKLTKIKDEKTELQNNFAIIAAKLTELQQQQKSITDEITEIEARPDSNIDIKYQQLRDELVSSLGINKEKCVFIGELIDVKDEQKNWQGAIERALGGLRTTLAVPADCFSMITSWLNTRHTGLHVRLQVVNKQQLKKYNEFKDNGFLCKLVWRKHQYREWLKQHLLKFDLQCVDSTEILDKTPFSMTEQGLMQLEYGRFEKKDQYKINDRKRWHLGFSNKSRLAILRTDQATISKNINDISEPLTTARSKLDQIDKRQSLCNKLLDYQWDEINVPYWQTKTEQLQQELIALERVGGNLEKAKKHWEEAKQQLANIRNEKSNYLKDEAVLNKSIIDATTQQTEVAKIAKTTIQNITQELLEKRIGELTLKNLDNISTLLNHHGKNIERKLEFWRNKKNSSEKSAIGFMSSFRSHEKWQVIATDWRADVTSINDYISHFKQLEKDGLPVLVDQFIKRLNKHATQSLARVKQRLDTERDDILERIDTINNVLQRTEFRSGTYLKLGTKHEKYAHVIEFKKKVSQVLSQSTSDDHDARFRQLKLVVDILEKASNSATSGSLESLRLLDPRYQISFYAEELDKISGDVRDVLESSSGKSGGEKESFAGTIVAASLAYVLTPDGYEHPVYSTVFLDEAFSNTAEAVSRRVLRVFKELHIHVNLITPYKNLNLARESARSLIIAERDAQSHTSRLSEVTWEEIDRQLANKHNRNIKQTLEIDIEVEEHKSMKTHSEIIEPIS